MIDELLNLSDEELKEYLKKLSVEDLENLVYRLSKINFKLKIKLKEMEK